MKNLTPIEYANQRILTTKQLADVYEADEQQIQQNFNNHKEKFEEGKHYYFLEGETLKEFKRHFDDIELAIGISKFVSKLYLWTERGANRHCKILDTDKAWQQFDVLEESYFQVKKVTQLQPPYNTAKAVGVGEVSNLVKTTVSVMSKQGSAPTAIARQVELMFWQFGIKTIPDFVQPSPYEQLNLDEVAGVAQ